jgi:hypothetical protein
MVVRIDDFLSEISAGGGMAMGNMFKVTLPSINQSSSESMSLLCKTVNLPGRQMQSAEKRSGMETKKVAYGYASDDVTMSFYLLNDYSAKDYFERWQDLVVNQDTKEIGYHNEYAKQVTIQQIRKGVSFPVARKQLFDAGKIPSSIRGRLPRLGPIDFAQGEFDLDVLQPDDIVYTCVLLDAYPTSLVALELGNENQLLEVSVQLSYTNWRSATNKQLQTQQAGEALVGGAIQFARGLF